MEVQEILEGKKKVVEFLKEKGLQEEKDYSDDEYTDGTFFKIDKRKLLVIYEVFEEEKIKEIKDHFLIDRGLSYCIIILDGKLIFFRNFGEIKHFIYSERTKNNPSKIDKLKNISAMDSLFQSKDISASFYEAFKLKRNLLVQNIKNDVEPVQKYLIAQKIFDRFFFIYFLCHKGIIKFKDGKKISGDNLFTKILLKKGNFLQNLKKLFHLFNSQPKNILEIGDYQIVIPYLNGGLFRPDVLEQDLDIKLKDDQWEEIFEFLNSYHWIIEDVKATEENEEKILTPEILGHVYERSVVEWESKVFEEQIEATVKKTTERKKKGVYYTPESITNHISTNTIIPSLLYQLGNKYSSFDDLIESNNKKDMKEALKKLDKIKVLDPACGSGAFLIKASEVIFGLKRRINYELKDKKNFYDLKLDIITENIYGVDILAGAIEISKLRLWLWLISDYEESKNEIKALPNIEYNLKVGNSLVGWLDEKLVQMPMNTPLTDKVDDIFTELIALSKNGEGGELKKARELLRAYKLNDYIEAYYILYKIYRRTHGLKAENLRSIIETIRKAIYATVTPAFLECVNKKIKPNYDSKKPPITIQEFSKLQVFHWRIDFGHIILNGGFDVVIGNPPYGNILSSTVNKILSVGHGEYSEIAADFLEVEMNILKKGGYIGNITTIAIIKNSRLVELHRKIETKLKGTKIASFARRPSKIFADAEINVAIIIASRGEGGIIETSDFIRFKGEADLQTIEYSVVSGLILRDKMGSSNTQTNFEVIPAVGPEIKREILLKLAKKKRIIEDCRGNNYPLFFRRAANYWMNISIEQMNSSKNMIEIIFDNELERDFIFLAMNSSLFYLFWWTFCNMHDVNEGRVFKFPVPDKKDLIEKSSEIRNNKTKLWKKLMENYYPDQRHQFIMPNLKQMIDEIEEFIGTFYDLNNKEIKFLRKYHSEFGRKSGFYDEDDA